MENGSDNSDILIRATTYSHIIPSLSIPMADRSKIILIVNILKDRGKILC
jgi:hypothetical protein